MPVIGGFAFALINLALRKTGLLELTFDTTLQNFFIVIFFISVGYVLKAAVPKVMTFLVLCTALCFFQDLVPLLFGPFVGLEKDLALMTGSVSMIGGHGVSGSITLLVEASGVAVAYASVAFGLVAGSLMGRLHKMEDQEVDIDESILQMDLRYLHGDRSCTPSS
ncbi:hypothetical protein GCM10009604_19250 [Corynebacterium aurimucosum]|uniref:sodium/glutamate symporter n=1 Tax=Corynebacterium aurimucosum TaxID=169292 RepID=UPI00191FEE7B|nr:sodium/glutamate symporter [Corynebacterium aurimucosum]QQU95465.1 hypothetical protein I6I66_12115 [Corynebacterium aurimucosum]UTA71633.1 hypothetical protein J3S22_00545 [Corynebacterium aurimucosum]WJY69866.1 Sodium/glutamate symporter [Corynebacterium aurimucosum]